MPHTSVGKRREPHDAAPLGVEMYARMLDREVLLALEDVHGLLDIVIAERDGTDGLREAYGLVERAHVDLSLIHISEPTRH